MDIPLTPEGLSLFRSYCGIELPAIKERAKLVREKALQVYQYRFIEAFRFLHPRIASNPFLQSIKLNGSRILDIGCGFGTDIRYLSLHGASPSNIFGHDIRDDFIRLGFELFKPITGFGTSMERQLTFLVGSVGKGEGELIRNGERMSFQWNTFLHKFDIIHAGSVLHLLTKEEGEDLIQKVHGLLKPNGFFIGRTSGAKKPMFPQNGLRTIHSVQSLKDTLDTAGFTDVKVVSQDREIIKKKEDAMTYQTLHFSARLPTDS